MNEVNIYKEGGHNNSVLRVNPLTTKEEYYKKVSEIRETGGVIYFKNGVYDLMTSDESKKTIGLNFYQEICFLVKCKIRYFLLKHGFIN